ncbi:hypothetical protein KJ885_05695 [Patescibacteria group bacterium]|nr:hypothetical protein [Patescibacteria group bacterium]
MPRNVYKDDGSGTTERSLKYWKNQRYRLGQVVEIEMRNYNTSRPHSLRIKDNNGNEIWLSGCVSGFGGTGPHGTLKILQEFRPKTSIYEIARCISFKVKRDSLGHFRFYPGEQA